jgi:hypothetical protein
MFRLKTARGCQKFDSLFFYRIHQYINMLEKLIPSNKKTFLPNLTDIITIHKNTYNITLHILIILFSIY